MKIGDKVIYTEGCPKAVIEYETIKMEVRIMAIAEGYAMVRRKGSIPFVCSLEDLQELE